MTKEELMALDLSDREIIIFDNGKLVGTRQDGRFSGFLWKVFGYYVEKNSQETKA